MRPAWPLFKVRGFYVGALVAFAIFGCRERGAYDAFTATDGTTFTFENHSGYLWPPSTTRYYAAALRASGAHDLLCPLDEIDGITMDDGAKDVIVKVGMPAASDSAVIGCGQRATYRLVPGPRFVRMRLDAHGHLTHDLHFDYRIVLVARARLGPPPAPGTTVHYF